jgi:hypothetical protein
MENKPKLDKAYILTATLAAAIGCAALTSVAHAQQSLDGDIADSTNAADNQPYTQEDLSVPEPQTPEPQSIDQNPESPAEYTLPPEAEAEAQAMIEIIDTYKRCVREIIASDTPTLRKREQIDAQCWAERQQIADALPQDLQEFMLLNMDRRIDLVLRTMAEAEGVVDNSMQDIYEAVSDLSAETGQEDSQ